MALHKTGINVRNRNNVISTVFISIVTYNFAMFNSKR